MTVEDAPTAPVSPERSLLKAHKVLPRRPQEQPLTYGVRSPVSSQGRRNSSNTHRISDPDLRSSSPLQDPILPTGAIALPPTPPKNPFDTSDGDAGPGLHVRRTRGMKFSEIPGTSTPRNQRSPPTPDITPPREPLKPSPFDQPLSKRVPSSRTESFSTAREHQPSPDEEPGRFTLHSANLTRSNSASASRSASTHEFGLGLDLESDGGGTSPLGYRGVRPFPNFDGDWDDKRGFQSMDWNDELMRNVTARKEADGWSRNKVSQGKCIGDIFGVDSDGRLDVHQMEELRSKERTDRVPDGKENSGTSDFIEPISWPTGHADSPDVEDRRLSNISMVVEAMVVDTTPQRTRTLRHTSKNSRLRSSSPDRERSVSNPEGQYPLQGRKNSRPLGKPRRAVSDASASIRSDGRPQQEVVPVVVIPERRSSLSAPTSKRARSSSLTSASVQTRTLPNTEGAFDTTLPRRRRTLSDAIPSASRSDRGWERDFNPVIPKRRSSLSAPTSRNVSRTTSLTSESIKPPRDPLDAGPADAQSQQRLGSHAYTASQDNRDSQHIGNARVSPPKRLVSPRYSQLSEMSKSPDVIEATAVSIFPHNNESLLVVQQNARNASGGLSFNPSTAPETPPTKHQETLSVESPLKNPRKPPKPPAFNVISPTPTALTPADEHNRQLPGSTRPSTAGGRLFSGPLSHVKRALSNRRHPENPLPLTPPVPRGVDGSTQTEGGSPGFRRPSLADAGRRDSKLHPLWKPRGFWDDLEDGDDEYFEEQPRQRDSVPVSVDMESGTGKEISFTPPRDTNGIRYISPQRSSDSLRIRKDQKTRRIHRIPGLGIHVEYIGWQGIQDRIKEAKARRENAAKEKQRNKLRRQIGTPKVIVQSVQV